MNYKLNLPINQFSIKKLKIGDVVYLTGTFFTARDEAHKLLLEKNIEDVPFETKNMALYHCGPLMKKISNKWQVISAGPTTSNRMEIFEDNFIEKFGTKIIIGKGGMGERTINALKRHCAVYMAYTGGAGALAADKVVDVPNVYWLKELGMPEAIWIFKVKEFGPLIVAMDSNGESIYEEIKNKMEK
jgi:tartrate/fumarate subfamily iron-sulfur-dependent hydro-lyase beta chain